LYTKSKHVIDKLLVSSKWLVHIIIGDFNNMGVTCR